MAAETDAQAKSTTTLPLLHRKHYKRKPSLVPQRKAASPESRKQARKSKAESTVFDRRTKKMRRTSLALVFVLVLVLSARSVVVSESTTETVMEEAKDTANAAKEAAGDAMENVKKASQSVSDWIQDRIKDVGGKD